MSDIVNRPLPPSFREAICRAERQVELWVLRHDKVEHLDIYREICKILAEVYMMRDEDRVRISGEWLDVRIVKDVFSEFGEMEARQVVGEYTRLTEHVRNPKAYLRTMIYNSVFSGSAAAENAYRSDLSKQ